MKRLAWAVLAVPLLAILLAVLFTEAGARPPDLGDEPTAALQAASLAWDLDLAYTDADHARFVEQWGVRPRGLDLDSVDGGATQVYGRPFAHALVAAPFARALPRRGVRVANALLLAAAALLAAWSLERRLGPAAPLWVAVFVFASAAFSYAFLATADVFLLAATAAGFALAFAAPPEEVLPSVYERRRPWSWRAFGRWLAVGVLLALPGAYRPLYLLLLPAAAFVARESLPRRRGSAWAGLGAGAAGLLAAVAFVHALAGGEPLWDPAAVAVQADPGLLLWNGVYFLAGRNLGVLPYFPPLLLALLAFRREGGRAALLLAAGLAALGFLLLRPYDFAGVGAGAGNRLFLPLYAALWFLPARQPGRRGGYVLAVAAVAGVLAAPFMASVWRHPAAPSPGLPGWLETRLPYEATQRDLPGSWTEEDGLRIKPTSGNVWKAERGGGFRVAGGEPGDLLVASLEPLERLVLDFDENAPSRLSAGGQELRPVVMRPDGSIAFEVAPGSGRSHPMWWTGGTYHLYSLGFRLPEAPARPIGFRVYPARDLIQRSGG